VRATLLAVAVMCLLTSAVAVCASDYLISQEDELAMSVWGEPQLSQIRLVVGPDGNVNVPIVGVVKAEGMTIDQLGEAIKVGLKDRQFVLDAKVQLLMLMMHKPTVSVLGIVGRPGKFEFKDGDTVMEAIAQAGSYSVDSSDLARATLTRRSGEVINLNLSKLYNKGDMTQNLVLKKGDTIFIPEDTKNKIYVLGEVLRPSMYTLKENMTALQAVSMAGGPTPDRGRLKGTMVIRGNAANPEKIKVDISKMIKNGDLGQDVALMAGDMVYVPKSSKPNLQEILSIVQAASSFRLLTQGFR
jgi:polysaccharide biosynthesis/export protein